VFVIGDPLSEEYWNQGYHSTEKLEGLRMAFGIAVEVLHEPVVNQEPGSCDNPGVSAGH
jgi:hypothetical protein